MFNLNFICRESKCDRRGYAPVELSIILNGERSYMLLPRRERPEDFKRLMAQRKGNDLKTFCNAMYKRVQEAVAEMYAKGLVVTPKCIKQYLKGEYVAVYTVGMLCKEYLAILAKRVDADDLTMCNYAKYEAMAERLYAKVGKDSDVSSITNGVVMDILVELKAKYAEATVSNYFTKLKSLVRYAIDQGKLSINPFVGIKVGKGEKEVSIISVDEYERIRDKEISICRLEKVRDLFVFACNSGISYCDVVSLKKEDFAFVGGRWVVNKERAKTGVKFYAVILDDGVKVLEKYDWDLSGLFMSNQKVNSYAKEIQDICGISSVDSLHFHLCRHFYITRLIRMGVPVSVVKMCAGHADVRRTMKYTHLAVGDVVSAVNCKC